MQLNELLFISPVQLNELLFISQFTADIVPIMGANNLVAEFLSRVEAVMAPVAAAATPPLPSPEDLATAQAADAELQTLRPTAPALSTCASNRRWSRSIASTAGR